MKKILVLVLLIVPFTAFGVPTIRALGTKPTTGVASGVKVTPTKTTTNNSSSARVGTLRAKTKTTGVVGAITGSNSRFPVISVSRPYASVAAPAGTNSNTASNVVPGDIVNTVINQVQADYVSKSDFNAALEAAELKHDSVRIGQNGGDTRVPIWIEEE